MNFNNNGKEDFQSNVNKDRKFRRNKKIKIAVATFVGILVTLLIIQGVSLYRVFYKHSYADSGANKNPVDNLQYKNIDGIKNILLLSSDAREDSDSERPDSIMILTIDGNKNQIRTTSILRDSYVEIGQGYVNQKINHAYSLGGLELMIDVVQRNYDIKIDNYVVVNFECFKKVVDLVGGIDAEIKDYELDEVNEFILEYGTGGTEEDLLDEPGFYTLNGKQALSYARIRKVGNGDYERAERQRYILKELIKKAMKINPLKYQGFLEEILPYLKTDLKPGDILGVAYTIAKMGDFTVEGMQVPVEGTYDGYIVNEEKGWLLFFDQELNKEYMHSFIFDGIKKEYSGEDLNLNDSEFDFEVYYQNSYFEDVPPVNEEDIPEEDDMETVPELPEEEAPSIDEILPPLLEEEEEIIPEEPVAPDDFVNPEEPVAPENENANSLENEN